MQKIEARRLRNEQTHNEGWYCTGVAFVDIVVNTSSRSQEQKGLNPLCFKE